MWGGIAVGGSGFLWIIPGINVLSAIIAIAGLILIVSRLGYLRAIIASVAGLAMALFIGSLAMGELVGMVNTGVFLVAVVAPGLAMGMASRAFSSAAKTVLFGFIPILALFALLLVFYSDFISNMPAFLGQINSGFEAAIDQSPRLSQMLSEQYGTDPGAREKFIEEVDRLIVFLIRIMPGTIIVGFLAIIMLGLVSAGSMASRLKLMVPRFPPFYLWRASDWWLLPTVIGLVFAIFASNDFWRYLGGNILVITGNVYALVGLAVLEAFLRRLTVPRFMRLVFYMVMILMSFFSLVFLAILGLADSRFNFKRESLDRDGMNIE